jgi:hypothetical protein
MTVIYQALELTLSSKSVWSTIESQVKLRQASVAGAALLLLWCLSPLGGQASLRLLRRDYTTHNTTVPLRYLSSGLALTASANGPACNSGNSAIYNAALILSPVIASGSEDMWGNVKIPRFQGLNTTHGKDDWKAVPSSVAADDYSSLLGVPVVNRQRHKNMTFSLESTYLNADCEQIVQMPYAINWTWPMVRELTDKIRFNLTPIAVAGLMPNPDGAKHRIFFFDTEQSPYDHERQTAFLDTWTNATNPEYVIFDRKKTLFGSVSWVAGR